MGNKQNKTLVKKKKKEFLKIVFFQNDGKEKIQK